MPNKIGVYEVYFSSVSAVLSCSIHIQAHCDPAYSDRRGSVK